MQTKEERIKALRDRAASRLEKIDSLPAVIKQRAAAEAEKAAAEKLEAEYHKEKADRDRRENNRAKIILGAGLLLLHHRVRSLVLRMVSAVLTPRDRDWLARWCEAHELDYAHPSTDELDREKGFTAFLFSEEPDPIPLASDLVGNALKSVVGSMNEGELGILIPDLLNRAVGNDRVALEAWLSALGNGR